MNKENLTNILIVISVVIATILIIWFIVGNTPTVDQILVGLVVTVYPFIFGVYERLNNKITKTGEKISDSRESLLKEMGDLKLMIGQLQGRVSKRG